MIDPCNLHQFAIFRRLYEGGATSREMGAEFGLTELQMRHEVQRLREHAVIGTRCRSKRARAVGA